MRLLTSVALILLAASIALADKQETVAELAARADAARPEERTSLYLEIAEKQLKSADELYTAGKVDQARAAVNDIVTYSEKSHDAAIQTGKKMKRVEISVRKMADRLRDIKRSLNFDDQAPVQAAVDRLESLRTDLLSHMFGKDK
jgi:polyhydroxyalkanoate synthesis regulator phasin